MATKAAIKAKNTFIQYSKKMCTGVAIFWIVYRLINFVIVLIRPEVAHALTDLCAGVDTVMIVNMGTYTANSSTEKIAIAYAKRRSLYNSDSSDEKEDDENDDGSDDSGNG